jgi:hypothetical protein
LIDGRRETVCLSGCFELHDEEHLPVVPTLEIPVFVKEFEILEST